MKTIRPGKSALNTKNVNAPILPLGQEGTGKITLNPEPPPILNDEQVNGPIWPLSSHGEGEVRFTIPPQKIPGLIWAEEDVMCVNLNQLQCVELYDKRIEFFEQKNGDPAIRWIFESEERAQEVFQKIRAMGVEL